MLFILIIGDEIEMSDKQRRCLENSKKNHKSRRSERLISPTVIALFTAAAIFISGFAAGRKYQSGLDNKPAVTTTIDNSVTKNGNDDKHIKEDSVEGPDYQSAYEQVQWSINDDKRQEDRRKAIEEENAKDAAELNAYNAAQESMNVESENKAAEFMQKHNY